MCGGYASERIYMCIISEFTVERGVGAGEIAEVRTKKGGEVLCKNAGNVYHRLGLEEREKEREIVRARTSVRERELESESERERERERARERERERKRERETERERERERKTRNI